MSFLKLQHGLFTPVAFYKIREIHDLESTFFQGYVFVKVFKSG